MSTRSCGHDSTDSDSIYVCLLCEGVANQRMKDEEWNAALETAAAIMQTDVDAAEKELAKHNHNDDLCFHHWNSWCQAKGDAVSARDRIRALKREVK